MGLQKRALKRPIVISLQFIHTRTFRKQELFRRNHIKIVFLTALVLLVPAIAYSQRKPSSSVCLKDLPAGVILNICTHERGMAPMPQPRLYLRVYTDGRAEFERHSSWDDLIKKEFRIEAEDVAEIVRLGNTEDFQAALEEYPAYNHGTDSSMKLTLDFYGTKSAKRIVFNNFYAADRKNKEHYPASFIALMERVEEMWGRANGIVQEIPTLSYCGLMFDREYMAGRRVIIDADIELGDGRAPYLHEPECDRPEMGKARTNERVGIGFDPKMTSGRDIMSEALRKIDLAVYGRRARVRVQGILRDERARALDSYDYRFFIERFISADKIVPWFEGELREGWAYITGFQHIKEKGLQLGLPLKMPLHHAVRVEWTNEDKFPLLRKSDVRFMTFRVVSKETRQVEKYMWRDVYVCEIIEVSLLQKTRWG